MHRVHTFILLHDPLYNYYQREDSIVVNYSVKNLDILRGLKERHNFIEREYHHLIQESYQNLLKQSLIHFNLLLMNRKVDPDYYHRNEVQKYVKNNYLEFYKATENDRQLNLQLRLFINIPI